MEGAPNTFRPEQEGEHLLETYQAAEREVGAILQDMNVILAHSDDRARAEQGLLKTHADRLDRAMQTARELLDRWLTYVRERGQEE